LCDHGVHPPRYQARGFSRCGRTLVQDSLLNMPASVAECKVMAVAFGIVDRTRISHNLTGRFSYWLQAAETLSVVPRPNERVSRATILLIIRLSSFDPVKNKRFARWPLLWHPKDDMAFAVLAETDRVPNSWLPESLLTRGAESLRKMTTPPAGRGAAGSGCCRHCSSSQISRNRAMRST